MSLVGSRSLRFCGSVRMVSCSRYLLAVSPKRYCSSSADISPGGSNEDEKRFRVLMLRLAKENSFLSWSRNATICAGVGATVNVIDGQSPFGHFLGAGFHDLGVLFMTIGCVHHVYSSIGLRQHLKISRHGLAWIVTYTTGIWLFYWALVKNKLSNAETTSN